MPLSEGRVRDGELECGYHGWRFDGCGRCVAVPGLEAPPEGRSRSAVRYPTREQDGFVWVFSSPSAAPNEGSGEEGSKVAGSGSEDAGGRRHTSALEEGPFRFPHLDDPRYRTVVRTLRARASLHAVLENTLDVPHTAYLHGGLFRRPGEARRIEVRVRRTERMIEAEYLGEAPPKGLAARLLAGGKGRGALTMTHFDRFLLPSIAQVEYRLGGESHLLVTSAMTPVGDFLTEVNAVVTYRLPLPGWAIQPLVAPVARWIFRQDAQILALQTDRVRELGGERYATTELDVLGPDIWRMLRAAGKGEVLPPDARSERTVSFSV